MNKTKFLQGDGRWGGLPYPKNPCYIRAVGCGEVSIANVLIEMEQYKKYTPATIQPYCKRYGAPNCDGTYLSGICAMMRHYGLTEVKECDNMSQLWKELAKGNRVAIYLMGSRPGGSKGIHWTSGGHFISSVGYRYENKKHYLYVKDPWTNDKNRNGWLTYEEHMKNDVVAVYVGKLTEAKVSDTTVAKLTVDGIGGEETVKAMQKFFGTPQDGVISGQLKKISKYYPSIIAVTFDKKGSGSACVKKLQKWLGLTQDGVIGKGTTAAWQKKLRDLGYLAKDEKIDGLFGVKSMKAWQRFLNDKLFPKKEETDKTPTDTTPTNKDETPKPPYNVIDVSDWQKTINWAKVKESGVVGAIIRYADGDTLDVKFERNMKLAKKNGLHIGAYIFSRAKTKAQAEKEAERLFNACKPYAPDMPLYIDLEAKGLEKYANTVAQAFLKKIKSLGGRGGVYADLNWWNNYLKPTSKLTFAMWVAQHNDTMDYKPATDVGMWQYSSSGKVNGISGKVDMDKCYVAYWETAQKEEPPKEEEKPTPPKKTIDELAQEVLDGKWGSGEARKENLTTAGYDYDAVQKRVNELVEEMVDLPDWVKRANAWAEDLADDPKAGYRKFNHKDKSTYECLLCHPETDPKHKWYVKTGNCIWESFGYWHHGGGIPCNCGCHVIDDTFMTKLLTMNKTKALKLLREKIGIDDIDLIRNNGKVIPKSKMKPGDLCIIYDSNNKATHIYPYIGDGYTIDCGNWSNKAKQIAKRKITPCKTIIRYTGK